MNEWASERMNEKTEIKSAKVEKKKTKKHHMLNTF